MEKAKKRIDYKGILLLVLVVGMVFALSITGTLAWFTDRDNASTDITLGQAVTVQITDSSKVSRDGKVFEIPAGILGLPGTKLPADLNVTLGASTTAQVLRVKFGVEVEFNTTPTEVPTGWTVESEGGATYTDGTLTGKTLTEAWEIVVKSAFDTLADSEVADGWEAYSDGFYYYLGTSSDGTKIMTKHSDEKATTDSAWGVTTARYKAGEDRTSIAADTTLASIIPGATSLKVEFLVNPDFRLPVEWTNQVAEATISVVFEAQVIQDQITNAAGTSTVLPNVTDVSRILNGLYPVQP